MFGVLIKVLIAVVVLAVVGLPAYRFARKLFGRTVSGRFWLAREGLVEDGSEAVVLFPWAIVNSFDKTSINGQQAVRIWLSEDAKKRIQLLNIHLPKERHQSWLSDRAAAMARSKYWTSAQLVLRQTDVEEPIDSFFTQLRDLARNPSAVEKLPSVLDDPDPLDLGALGLDPTTEEKKKEEEE